MFCPKCGMENTEGSSICRGCGWVLASAAPTVAAAVKAKTSGLAIASFVLGILGFCCCFLSAPLAFILGIIAMVMISKSNGRLKGTGFAIAGIVIPVVAIPLIVFMTAILGPRLEGIRDFAQQKVCEVNLKGLGLAMTHYAENNNGKYPSAEKWCDLLIEKEGCSKKMFRCPGDEEGPSNYAMNKNAEKIGDGTPGDMVLLFESKPGWNLSGGPELLSTENHSEEGCNILFCDGQVKFVRADDINSLKWTAGP